MPLTKKGKKIMSAMKKQYGPQKGKSVFYASKNAGKISGVDKGFYGHMTHASIQPNEDSVECFGSGQSDADFPKTPKTDYFFEGGCREIY